jgi:glucose/mannose transport system permease protein
MVYLLFLFGMFIPYQAVMIPLVQLMTNAHLIGGIPGLMLAHIVYGIPSAP